MTTYKVIRFFKEDPSINGMVVKSGLTIEEAMDHCNDPETSSSTATGEDAAAVTKKYGEWFDGWTENK
jgi:hypothetical protein